MAAWIVIIGVVVVVLGVAALLDHRSRKVRGTAGTPKIPSGRDKRMRAVQTANGTAWVGDVRNTLPTQPEQHKAD